MICQRNALLKVHEQSGVFLGGIVSCSASDSAYSYTFSSL